MIERLVVCFRFSEPLAPAGLHLASARALCQRAFARGGRLVSWGVDLYAFELDPDAAQDAIELAVSVLRDAAPGRAPAVGISEGALERSEELGVKLCLTWGPALLYSAALANAARPGEVLVDPALPAAKHGELLATGSRVSVYGKVRVRGLLLDRKHPWRTSVAEARMGWA